MSHRQFSRVETEKTDVRVNMGGCLIVGVGNPMRRDDGVGPEVIRRMMGRELPRDVNLQVRETDMFVLLEELREYRRAIIVDAVDMEEEPGSVRIFTPEEAALNIQTDALSTHGFGLRELIAFAEQMEISTELLIAGMQVGDISFGEGLTPPVEAHIDEMVERIIQRI